MKKIAVSGIGMTRFGEWWELSLKDLFRMAALDAIKDANMSPGDIEAVFVGNMLASAGSGQLHLGSLVTSELGIRADAVHVEAACASGGMALLRAADSIRSERYSKVLVVGAEKMTDLSGSEVVGALAEAADEERESRQGATFAALYALLSRIYMDRYGVSEADLAAVAVKNHYHASLNPKAHFRQPITINDVLRSPPIATPLKLLDCSPISDGAAAVVLCGESHNTFERDTVYLMGSGAATDTLSLAKRSDMTCLPATQMAARKAYAEAKVKAGDIDIAEVHDCFTIAELMAMEDLGFFGKGLAAKAIAQGETNLDGKLPINTSGGLKGCGHPVGATGIKQVVEVINQLRGTAGKRQVKKAKIGLTHNVGGSGATCVVHIFGRGNTI